MVTAKIVTSRKIILVIARLADVCASWSTVAWAARRSLRQTGPGILEKTMDPGRRVTNQSAIVRTLQVGLAFTGRMRASTLRAMSAGVRQCWPMTKESWRMEAGGGQPDAVELRPELQFVLEFNASC